LGRVLFDRDGTTFFSAFTLRFAFPPVHLCEVSQFPTRDARDVFPRAVFATSFLPPSEAAVSWDRGVACFAPLLPRTSPCPPPLGPSAFYLLGFKEFFCQGLGALPGSIASPYLNASPLEKPGVQQSFYRTPAFSLLLEGLYALLVV